MNNYCTTPEQGKKLLELGLDPEETADMYWRELKYSSGPTYELEIRTPGMMITSKVVSYPAWSSLALLGLMPECIRGKDGLGYWSQLTKDDDLYVIKYWSSPHGDYMTAIHEADPDLTDCAFRVVSKLLEGNYI